MKWKARKLLASMFLASCLESAWADDPAPAPVQASSGVAVFDNVSAADGGPDNCRIPPPMFGDIFVGGLRGQGAGMGVITRFIGFGDQAAEIIPINTAAVAPRGQLTSSGFALTEPFTSINPLTGLTNRTVIALNPNQQILALARARFPGATFIGSQAVPLGIANQVPTFQGATRSTVGAIGATGAPATTPVLTGGSGATITPFPGSTPNQDLTQPGGGAIAAGDEYVILNTINTGGSAALLLPTPGGTSRFTKIAENGSPLPQDRVIFNYNYLNNAMNGANINHFMFAVEKTFLDGQASIQVNVPFASTLSSTQFIDQGADAIDTQFGNVSVWLKYLVARSEDAALSVGLGVNTPTADDVSAFMASTDTIAALRINNESILLSPFVGAYYMPSNWFVQGFTQIDVDVNGNPVLVNGNQIGRLYSAVLMSVSTGIGYNYQTDGTGWVSRITPMTELHYTTSLGTANTFQSGLGSIQDRTNRLDVLNVTTGVALGLGDNVNLNLGIALPLQNDGDRQYDWQAFAQLQYRFGGR